MDAINTLLVNRALRGAIQTVAPRVAGALAGPAGPLAEGVVRRVAREVLGEPDARPERVAERLAEARPKDTAALAKIEAELEMERTRIAAEDRADARARQIAMDDPTPARLTYLAFAALCATFVALLFVNPQGSTRDMLMVIVGALITLTKEGFGFHVGSSKGSKDKTALMSERSR